MRVFMSIPSIDQVTQINHSILEVKRELRGYPTSERVYELIQKLTDTMTVLHTMDNNNSMNARVFHLMGECKYILASNDDADDEEMDEQYFYEKSFDEHLKSLQFYFQETGLIDKNVEGNQVIKTLLTNNIETFKEKLSCLDNKELRNIVCSLGMAAFKYDLDDKANRTEEVEIISLRSLEIIFWAINTKNIQNKKRLEKITNQTTLLMHNLYYLEYDANKQKKLFTNLHKSNHLPLEFYNCSYNDVYNENIIEFHINNLKNAKNIDEKLLELGEIQKTCLNKIILENFRNIENLFQYLKELVEEKDSLASDYAESLLLRLNNNPFDIQLNIISQFEDKHGPAPLVDLADKTTPDILNRENAKEHMKRNIGIVKTKLFEQGLKMLAPIVNELMRSSVEARVHNCLSDFVNVYGTN